MELFISVFKIYTKIENSTTDLHVCSPFLLHHILLQVFAPKTQSITAQICADNKIICYLSC